jgi:hypothetical protein
MLRTLGAAALTLVLTSPVTSNAFAAGQSGLVHRVSCTMVRYYVSRYSESAAEMWARSHGATDAQIEAARRCLYDGPAQTAQASRRDTW